MVRTRVYVIFVINFASYVIPPRRTVRRITLLVEDATETELRANTGQNGKWWLLTSLRTSLPQPSVHLHSFCTLLMPICALIKHCPNAVLMWLYEGPALRVDTEPPDYDFLTPVSWTGRNNITSIGRLTWRQKCLFRSSDNVSWLVISICTFRPLWT